MSEESPTNEILAESVADSVQSTEEEVLHDAKKAELDEVEHPEISSEEKPHDLQPESTITDEKTDAAQPEAILEESTALPAGGELSTTPTDANDAQQENYLPEEVATVEPADAESGMPVETADEQMPTHSEDVLTEEHEQPLDNAEPAADFQAFEPPSESEKMSLIAPVEETFAVSPSLEEASKDIFEPEALQLPAAQQLEDNRKQSIVKESAPIAQVPVSQSKQEQKAALEATKARERAAADEVKAKEQALREEAKAKERAALEEKARLEKEERVRKKEEEQEKKKEAKEKAAKESKERRERRIANGEKPFMQVAQELFKGEAGRKRLSLWMFKFFPFVLAPYFHFVAWTLVDQVAGHSIIQCLGLMIVIICVIVSMLNSFRHIKKVGFFPGYTLGIRNLCLMITMTFLCNWDASIKNVVIYTYVFLAASGVYCFALEWKCDFSAFNISYEEFLKDTLCAIGLSGVFFHLEAICMSSIQENSFKLLPLIFACLQALLCYALFYYCHFKPVFPSLGKILKCSITFNIIEMAVLCAFALQDNDSKRLMFVLTSHLATFAVLMLIFEDYRLDRLEEAIRKPKELKKIPALLAPAAKATPEQMA